MDIIKLRKQSILVPTPGQTEQEYLAAHLMKKKWCFSISQKNFSIETALEKVAQFDYAAIPPFEEVHLEETLKAVMNTISNHQPGNEHQHEVT